MKHLIHSILIALLTAVLYFPVFATQVKWHTISDEEAEFTVSFPGQPTYQQSASPETGQPHEIYSFYYNGHTLEVHFQPLAPPPRTPLEVNQVLSGSANVFARNMGTLLRQEKLPGGGRQFDNIVKTKSGTLHVRSRLYIHRGKSFILSCGSYNADGINERIAEQFFNSFSFNDSLPNNREESRISASKRLPSRVVKQGRWYKYQSPDGDFTVEFPDKPEYLQLKLQGTDNPLHRYHFFFGENYFMVSYYDTNITRGSSEQIIQRAVENYLTAYSGWRLIGKIKLSEASYQVEMQGVVEGFPIQMRTRFYLRSARLYFITTHTKNLSGPNKDDVSRFFSSFRLL